MTPARAALYAAALMLMPVPASANPAAPPCQPGSNAALARQAGDWEGVFQRFDAAGTLVEQFRSRIAIVMPDACNGPYTQTNIYYPVGKPPQTIASSGTVIGGVIRFENDRIAGWAAADPHDSSARISTLHIQNKHDAGYMFEQIHLSSDGNRRFRVAQYFDGTGQLLRRTLINEVRAAR